MKRLVPILLLLVSSTAMADWTLKGTGTAFVVNNNYALTAAHVLKECDGASIRHQHKEMEAEIVVVDVPNDLGLLLLKEPFEHTAKFRSGKAIRLGDTVVNYGYPLFGQLSDHAKVTTGEINSLAGWNNDSREIQYDAATQPGNSGGPVLDQSGNIVGVVTSGLSGEYAEETGHIAQSVNFAVKSFVAEAFLSANGVDYETAESIEKLETADIAEKAETFTVLVGCWEGFAESEGKTTQPEEAQPEESVPTTEESAEPTPCQPYQGCDDSLVPSTLTEPVELAKGVSGIALALSVGNDRLRVGIDYSGGDWSKTGDHRCLKSGGYLWRGCRPLSGDYLLTIDGRDVGEMSPKDALKLLEGPVGTSAHLHLRRSQPGQAYWDEGTTVWLKIEIKRYVIR